MDQNCSVTCELTWLGFTWSWGQTVNEAPWSSNAWFYGARHNNDFIRRFCSLLLSLSLSLSHTLTLSLALSLSLSPPTRAANSPDIFAFIKQESFFLQLSFCSYSSHYRDFVSLNYHLVGLYRYLITFAFVALEFFCFAQNLARILSKLLMTSKDLYPPPPP